MDIYTLNFTHRFDLMAKVLYIKYKGNYWYTDLYINNIQTFNGGWEYPGTKTDHLQFIESFNELIESFDSHNFLPENAIPLGCNNIIHNGAHRLAISYVNKLEPVFEKVQDYGCMTYDYNFFRNRNPTNTMGRPTILSGMKEKYMDRMALEFCFNVKGFKIICLYPRAKGKDKEVERILNKNGSIITKDK